MHDEDVQHLQILSIFHYVVGGLAALFACFPLLHLFVGMVLVIGGVTGRSHDAMSAAFGLFFVVFAMLFILAGWTFAVLMVVAGRSLRRHRNYMFCLVMAGVACIFVPFGTVLGIFTILVLMRPSVKRLFGVTPPPEPPPQ